MAFVFGVSSKGKQTVILRGFEYVRECQNLNGTTSWRCRMYQKFNCKARVVTSGDKIVREAQKDHTHEGNLATSLARKAVGEMKEQLGGLMVTPSSSQAAVCATLDDNILMALPKRATLSRALQRKRLKLAQVGNDGLSFPALPVDLNFAIPDQFKEMVLYDSGPGENRIILMGCEELLDGLARADLWLADGTFKVVPTVFFQLYSIHFNFGSGIHPAALYCLLTNKTSATYERVLQELQRMIPLACPQTILVDFEKASVTSFSSAYRHATVTGCYFHLCQSVIRKVSEVGLKTAYENNDAVRRFVRCLPALAFVPPEDVIEAFDLLVEEMPVDIDHLDELTTYFEHTYVRGRRQRGRGDRYGSALFPVGVWNQHTAGGGGIARTTNSVEGWHHGLQSLFMCNHPTVWSFMTGLQRDMQLQKSRFLQGMTGVEHCSSLKYRTLNERVKRAVATYGRADILTYLNAIAHLSHK